MVDSNLVHYNCSGLKVLYSYTLHYCPDSFLEATSLRNIRREKTRCTVRKITCKVSTETRASELVLLEGFLSAVFYTDFLSQVNLSSITTFAA